MDFLDTPARAAALAAGADPLLVHALHARLRALSLLLAARLARVERALADRDLTAALAAADESPTLRSLAAACDLSAAPAWPGLLRSARLPAPEAPLARVNALLALLASRPLGEDEPVPSAYRRAMRSGSSEEAWRQLRLWCLAEPEDATLASQRDELERQLAGLWLGSLLAGPAEHADARLLERLASLPRAVAESLPAWERARTLLEQRSAARRLALLARLEHSAGAITADREPEPLLPALADLSPARRDAALAGEWLLLSTLAPAPAENERTRGETLAAKARAALADETERAAAAARLTTLDRDLPACADAYEDAELARLADELTALCPRLETPRQAEARALAAEARRQLSSRAWQRRRRLAGRTALVGAATGLLAAVGYQLAVRIDHSDTPRPAAQAQADAQQTPPAGEPRRDDPPAADSAAIDEFYRRARETEQALTQPPSLRGAIQAEARIAELAQLASGLPTLRQREADARLSVLRATLASWRSELQEAARQALAAAEAARRSELGPDASPEAVRRALTRISPLIDSASEIAANESVGVPQVLRGQIESLLRDLVEAGRKLAEHDAAAKAWRAAANDAEYRRALSALAGSPFTADPLVKAATTLSGSLPDGATLVQLAFAPAAAEAFRHAASGQATFGGGGTVPPAVASLIADPTLRDVHQYVLVSRSDAGPGAPVVLYTAGPMVTEEFTVGGEVRTRQAARVLTGEGVVEREFISRIGTEGQRFGESLELGYKTPEAALVEQLAGIVDSTTGQFTQTPLGFLETLALDDQAAPVFKAHLLLGLGFALEARPLETGYAYSPSARDLVSAVRQLCGGSLRATSWVEPAYRGLNVQLARQFREAAPAAFLAEARACAGIHARLAAERFEFAGYTDEAGGVAGALSAPDAQLWGFAGDRLRFQPVLRQSQPPPVPLSPLYRFSADPTTLLRTLLSETKLPDASLARLRKDFER